MKTWEMIKELTENRGKKFKLKGENNIIYTSDLHSEGKIELDQVDFITIYDEWEEVKEPVTFMEAIKAEYFSIEHNFIHRPISNTFDLASLINYFWENLSEDEMKEVILNGKFYIEN